MQVRILLDLIKRFSGLKLLLDLRQFGGQIHIIFFCITVMLPEMIPRAVDILNLVRIDHVVVARPFIHTARARAGPDHLRRSSRLRGRSAHSRRRCACLSGSNVSFFI